MPRETYIPNRPKCVILTSHSGAKPPLSSLPHPLSRFTSPYFTAIHFFPRNHLTFFRLITCIIGAAGSLDLPKAENASPRHLSGPSLAYRSRAAFRDVRISLQTSSHLTSYLSSVNQTTNSPRVLTRPQTTRSTHGEFHRARTRFLMTNLPGLSDLLGLLALSGLWVPPTVLPCLPHRHSFEIQPDQTNLSQSPPFNQNRTFHPSVQTSTTPPEFHQTKSH
jgi:hypothetical protein